MRLIVTVALALLLGGCNEGGSGYDGPVNSCRRDRDCESGTTCDSDLSRCVVPGTYAGRQYYVKVMPPLDMDVPPQVFSVTLDEQGNVAAPLEVYAAADPVFLDVRAEDRGERIQARVLFTESIESVATGLTRAYGVTAVETSLFYMTDLLPGFSRYRVKVIPAGDEAEDYPARYYDDVEVTSSGGLLDSEGLKLDSLEVDRAYVYVTGAVEREGWPVDNVTVEARDPLGGRLLSTRSITGCGGVTVCGRFTIGLAPQVTSFSLKIFRPSEPWYPAVTVPDISIETILQEQGTGSVIDLGTIAVTESLGALTRYRAHVEAPVILADGSTVMDGVGDCRVVFESHDVAGGHAVRYAKTDQYGDLVNVSGNPGVDLFSGTYEVTVIPPVPFNDSVDDFGVFNLEDSLEVTADMDGSQQVFTLVRRPTITGRVVGDGKQLLYGAIRAAPVGEVFSYSRSNTASIGSDGTFVMGLDNDAYRLVAEAPPESGFAFGVVQVNPDEMCDMGDDEECTLDIRLPIPFVSTATVVFKESTGTAGSGLAGAAVEWYEVDETDQNEFHLVGRFMSDEEGRVTALLPPTVQYVERQP